MTEQKSSGTWIWVIVILLIILHQDNWLWENETLVFGFIPIGLFFHACISTAAAITWFLGTQFAWPGDVVVAADSATSQGAESNTETEGGASE